MNNFKLNQVLRKDCFDIADLPLCKVLMLNDKQYPWFILVPRIEGLTEIYQLSDEDYKQFSKESNWLGQWLMESFEGDKLNVAALGNVVSQLHIHHIVRFRNDACWPKPVWGTVPAIPFDGDDASKRITDVKAAIDDFQARS